MKNLSIEQRNNLCDLLAKLVLRFKQNNNIQCITFSVKDDYIEFKTIVNTGMDDFRLRHDISVSSNLYSNSYLDTDVKIKFVIDESCYYSNKFDDKIAFNAILKKDFMESIILYEKSAKYKMIQNKLYLQERIKQDNLDLSLYNIRK